MIRILYFASLRERIGIADEEIELPTVTTIQGVMEILKSRNDVWSDIFSSNTKVLTALNQEMASIDAPIKDGDEVAFFPPVTGG